MLSETKQNVVGYTIIENRSGLFFILLFMLSFFCEAIAQEEERNIAAAQLVEAHCTRCHENSNYREKTHTKPVWTLVVLRMQLFNGATFKRDERAIIIDYLTETRPASPMRATAEFFALILPILFFLILIIYYYGKRSKKD